MRISHPCAAQASNGAKHKTTQRRSTASYYTPSLLAKVKQAYWMDYEMLDAIGYGPHDARRPRGARTRADVRGPS